MESFPAVRVQVVRGVSNAERKCSQGARLGTTATPSKATVEQLSNIYRGGGENSEAISPLSVLFGLKNIDLQVRFIFSPFKGNPDVFCSIPFRKDDFKTALIQRVTLIRHHRRSLS